ncbi:hypothetical protein Q9966_004259 [Columba livia]|nr:hypothetical protein Q9966_004259 [Columba livia]
MHVFTICHFRTVYFFIDIASKTPYKSILGSDAQRSTEAHFEFYMVAGAHLFKAILENISPRSQDKIVVIDYFITHGIEFDWVHLYNNISDAIRNGHVKVTMYERVGKDLEQYVLHGS